MNKPKNIIKKHKCGCWHTVQTEGAGGGKNCKKHKDFECCSQELPINEELENK